MDTFSRTYRTRGYEADPTRAVPLVNLARYFGALRWEVMLGPELHLVDSLRAGSAFVIHQQRLAMVRPVGVGVDLEVSLWWEHVGRSSVRIVQRARRLDDGAVVAVGRVTCAWLGPDRHLARLPPAFCDVARAIAGDAEGIARATAPAARDAREVPAGSWIDPAPRVYDPGDLDLDPPEDAPEDARRTTLSIRPSEVDMFAHVNASHYLSLADDARQLVLPRPGRIVRCALAYTHEIRARTVATVALWAFARPSERVGFVVEGAEPGVAACRGALDVVPL